MINKLKSEFKIGDVIRLILISGKEPEGEILEIGDDFIVILNTEKVKQTFFENLLGGWEVISLENSDNINTKTKSTENQTVDQTDEEKISKKEELQVEKELEEPSRPRIGVKVVGKIDLSKFEKKTKKNSPGSIPEEIKKSKEKQDFSVSGRFGSIEEFKRAVADKNISKLVPANAYIIKHAEERGFGFLRNPLNVDIYFNYKNIIDDELRNLLKGTKNHLNIQVCCSLSNNWKGEKAISIHFPWTIEKSVTNANELIKQEDYLNAKNIAEQILEAFPGNIDAENILKKIEERKKAVFYRPKGFDPIYFKARKAKDSKNYEDAIRFFIESIENEERLDSSVKDLAATYQELGEIEKGVLLLEKYIDYLPANTATYNFASNYYSAAGEFEKALLYLEELEEITPSSKLSDVLMRQASCLIQMERFEEALENVEEILSSKKEHPFASKMREKLVDAMETGVYEKLDSFVDDTDFSLLTGGLPHIINKALENCDYSGLTASVRSKNSFNKTHLKQIRKLISEAGKARPKERAKYLLTESKLVQLIDPEDEKILRSTLSRYCTAQAISYEVEKYSPEISRYYYLLSFELENSWQSNANQVSYYLMSFLNKPTLSSKTIGLDELFKKLKFNENVWNGIIDLLISNSQISAVIVDRLYNVGEIKNQAVEFIKNYLELDSPIKNLEDFKTLWNKVREKRKQDFSKLFGIIKSIQRITTIEELTQQLKNFEPFFNVSWLPNIDIRRLEDLFTDIYASIVTYFSQASFDDKEKFKGLIIGQISQLQEEIEEQPSRFSYNGLLPLLKHIEVLVNQSFRKILESSTPKISLSILGESRFLDEKNNVSIQVSIKNEKGCSPIHNLSLEIQPNSDYVLKETLLSSSESLKGGEEKIVTVPLIVNSNALKQKATIIYIKGSYFSRNSDEPIEFEEQKLSVNFYSKDNFEKIQNPFATVADSGPVKDKSMFFGREALIQDISSSLLSQETNKCIIIQGQKRSGKSSVLIHLKENLVQTGKFVCVDFSLGLTENLDSTAFFWQILNGISEFLEDFQTTAEEKPIYFAPKISDFSVNPSIVFYEQIKIVRKEFSKFESWKEKMLLLMIDEFTYLYSAILRGKISPDFMKTWKSLLEKGIFSAVLIGQDVMPKFKQKFPNEFGVTEDRRLTYLKPVDAKQLIEKPIWDSKNNRSRYIGKAIEKIIDYTSLNPYYIQIFCARLVDFMNDNKLIVVTEADISEVAKTFTEGTQALPIDKFDNLLNAGDADLEAIPQEDTLEILRQIANNSRVIGSCSRDSIKLNGNEEYVNQILDDLVKRDVIICPNKGYYRIQVQIFNDWLLKH